MDDNLLVKIKKILNFLEKKTNKFDVVILLDYGHGFINKDIYDVLREKSKFLSLLIVKLIVQI